MKEGNEKGEGGRGKREEGREKGKREDIKNGTAA
jgi:hypothetical protein